MAMWLHVVLCRLTVNTGAPDDDRMIETCRSIFKKVLKTF